MSPDSSRHQVNTPDFQSVHPRPYAFLQRWMWWTRLRSACWCMLIYSATEKPLSSYGNRFPSLIPTEGRGGTLDIATRFSILSIGLTLKSQYHFLSNWVRACTLVHSPPAAPPVAACEAWHWPPWQKGQWSGPWTFQCFLPRSGALCLCFVSRSTCGERATVNRLDHFGRNWLLFSNQMNSPAACL